MTVLDDSLRLEFHVWYEMDTFVEEINAAKAHLARLGGKPMNQLSTNERLPMRNITKWSLSPLWSRTFQ